MAYVRVLIDGYSLLHAWPEVAKGQARHSATAREALIQILQRYADTIPAPVTLVFDGGGAPPNTPKPAPASPLEILYSGAGQTADDVIERVANRLRPFGDFMVVTNDFAERETVFSLGGMAVSCENFIKEVEGALAEFQSDLKRYNRQEVGRYKRSVARED